MSTLENASGNREELEHPIVSREAVTTVLGVLRRAIQETRNFPDPEMNDEEYIAHCQEFLDVLESLLCFQETCGEDRVAVIATDPSNHLEIDGKQMVVLTGDSATMMVGDVLLQIEKRDGQVNVDLFRFKVNGGFEHEETKSVLLA